MFITVYEVGPRDGLQNEQIAINVEDKIHLIRLLSKAGLQNIEVTSLVHPKWIPPLADATEVLKGISQDDKTQYSVLVPNLRGLERLQDNQVQEVALFLSASETHNQKNTNKSRVESLHALRETAYIATKRGFRLRGYVSTVFGCPYEGDVSLADTRWLIQELFDMGVSQISIGDTIGVATPKQVHEVFSSLVTTWGSDRFAAHFHDTRGSGLANVVAALQEGITVFDSSVGGLGGCPYAPGAAGNIATEDLVYLLEGMGYETGIDMSILLRAGQFIQGIIGRELPSKMLKTIAG
ncbi:hydroxymethylglutaryl-CoA lyase [Brevibacillus daliensis]|uniref:hydroxymethylglutaryl-CoA lyase n=1 Tax=Brevibacillus daliensis TaxID=2892995 RepID=UPI001E3372F7|nr:hydroxymethylglutaryl-CoA lyase [Brevibacillus daliensis]